jgi:hypothetical protein
LIDFQPGLVCLGLSVICALSLLIVERLQSDPLLKWILLGALLLGYFLPGFSGLVLHFYTDFPLQTNFGNLYLIESVLLACAIVILCALKKPVKTYQRVSHRVSTILLAVVILIGNFLTSETLSYSESNDISHGLQSGVEPFFKALVLAYLISVTLFNRKVILFAIAYSAILIYSLKNGLAGDRVLLLLPIFIIFFKLINQFGANNIRFWLSIAFVSILTLAAVWISLVVEKTRGGQEDFGNVSQTFKFEATDVLASAYTKFNTFTTGHDLIEIHGAGTAHFLPYWGSLLFPIPRLLLPSKPVPGSVTEDRFGTPSRLLGAHYHPGSTVYSVGVSPLATAVWHWGWILGSTLFSVCVLLNLLLIRYCVRNKYLLLRVLGISLIPIPSFSNLIVSPDVFVKNLVILIVFLVFCIVADTLKKPLTMTV